MREGVEWLASLSQPPSLSLAAEERWVLRLSQRLCDIVLVRPTFAYVVPCFGQTGVRTCGRACELVPASVSVPGGRRAVGVEALAKAMRHHLGSTHVRVRRPLLHQRTGAKRSPSQFVPAAVSVPRGSRAVQALRRPRGLVALQLLSAKRIAVHLFLPRRWGTGCEFVPAPISASTGSSTVGVEAPFRWSRR